jgi:hypothetical protein
MQQLLILNRKVQLLILLPDILDDLINVELRDLEWSGIDFNYLCGVICLLDGHVLSVVSRLSDPLVVILHLVFL